MKNIFLNPVLRSRNISSFYYLQFFFTHVKSVSKLKLSSWQTFVWFLTYTFLFYLHKQFFFILKKGTFSLFEFDQIQLCKSEVLQLSASFTYFVTSSKKCEHVILLQYNHESMSFFIYQGTNKFHKRRTVVVSMQFQYQAHFSFLHTNLNFLQKYYSA